MSNDIEIRRQIDAICNEYEESWSLDRRPDFDSYLQQIERSFQDDLLKHLLEIDVELRLNADQRVNEQD